MNTRREMAIALLGLPLIARAVPSELPPDEKPEQTPDQNPGRKPEMKQIPPPGGEAAARIISYTIYAEARGESFEGMQAVGAVIKTRALRARIPLAEVCLQAKQFSCWNNLDDVPEFYISGAGIEGKDQVARGQCYALAWILMLGEQKWAYLTHFYNPDKATPDWAYELRGTRKIGRHIFGYIN